MGVSNGSDRNDFVRLTSLERVTVRIRLGRDQGRG